MEGLLQKLLSESPPNVFRLQDALQTPVETLQSILNDQGVLIIDSAFTPAAYSAARAKALNAFRTDVCPQLTNVPSNDADLFTITGDSRYWATGIIGNATFGYLIAQPEAQAPRVELSDGLNVAVAMGSAYQANLELLSHPDSVQTLDLLMSVTGNNFISQDFCKLHRGKLTSPHVDIYQQNEERIHRAQAIAFGPAEGTVKLCFARFSHRPEIRDEIVKLIDKNIYGTRGFQQVPVDKQKSLLAQLNPVIQCGEPSRLVIWKPAIIHMELQQTTKALVSRNDSGTNTERYVVGTHHPVDLSQTQLKQIAFLAERGFIFHPYGRLNADNAAGTNSVHLKRTQFKRSRVQSADEKQRLQTAIQELPCTDDELNQFTTSLSGSKKRCYGIE